MKLAVQKKSFMFRKICFLEFQKKSQMHDNFDDEDINIKGRALRKLLKDVAEFSATNYLSLTPFFRRCRNYI